MIISYSIDGYRAALLDIDQNDMACNWRSYVIVGKGNYAIFSIPNEYIDKNSYFYNTVEQYINSFKMNKEQSKMTRKEAHTIAFNVAKNLEGKEVDQIIKILEALGLLKFDEPKEARVVFEINLTSGDVIDNAYKYGQELVNQYGTIRLELWSEGLVLWVGGEIKWKSWEKIAKVGDYVDIDWYDYPATNKVYTGQIRKIK